MKTKIVNEDGGKNSATASGNERRRIVIVLLLWRLCFAARSVLDLFQIYKRTTSPTTMPTEAVADEIPDARKYFRSEQGNSRYTENRTEKLSRLQYGELYAHIIGYSSSQYGRRAGKALLICCLTSAIASSVGIKRLVIKNDREQSGLDD